jgi:hypothetical protein
MNLDPLAAKNTVDFGCDIRILAAEKLRPALDQADAAAEAPVRLGEFEADIPAAAAAVNEIGKKGPAWAPTPRFRRSPAWPMPNP